MVGKIATRMVICHPLQIALQLRGVAVAAAELLSHRRAVSRHAS